MLQVQIHLRPGTDLFDIWIVRQGAERRRVALTGDLWTEEEIDQRVAAEPSVTMPAEILKALVAEASDVMPPDRAHGRHLDDAIKVRDRLLDLLLDAPKLCPGHRPKDCEGMGV